MFFAKTLHIHHGEVLLTETTDPFPRDMLDQYEESFVHNMEESGATVVPTYDGTVVGVWKHNGLTKVVSFHIKK